MFWAKGSFSLTKDSVKGIRVRLILQTLAHIVFNVHFCIVVVFGFTMIPKALNNENEVIRSLAAYALGFGTNWNVLFQTTFLSLALSYDMLQWLDKHESRLGKAIKYYRDLIFSGLVVPVTMFVTSMFWIVYNIDRELVFPTVYDDIVPWWFNHCVHTNIFIIIVIETLLQARRYPVNWKLEHILVWTCIVSYAVVYYSIYFFGHRWLYQVFGIMNWWQVCLFQLLIWGSSYLFYRLQYPINRLIHGSVDEVENTSQSVCDSSQSANSQIAENHNGYGKVRNGNNGTIENGNGNLDASGCNTNGNGVKSPDVPIDSFTKGSPTMRNEMNRAPFSDRTWSMKYRTIRSQFENSSL